MKDIIDKNYFINKLSRDKEIIDLISKQSDKQNVNFFENLKKIKDILHLKNQTDKKILDEYEKLIIIPTGTEETLIRELNQFNKEMYDNLPEHYIIDFDKTLTTDTNSKLDISKINNSKKIKKDYKKNILNLSNPYIQDSSIAFDEQEHKEIDPYVEKTIHNFEDLFNNDSLTKDNQNYINNLLDDNQESFNLVKSTEQIYAQSIEEKEKMISEIRESLVDGNYGKLNLTKPLSISTARYMRKLASLKKGFIKSYGGELFKKISEWVHKEEVMFENMDRAQKIDKLAKQKIKLINKKNSK
ncbi:hypothetical protein [Spiroplasma floricola]|uniref:Uncharacterized protein n=1 Tax=Spiroplasma floricola 23-6 TaxID=1336749 RepID=A0A2K8SFP4_9MOLU|nr:hypothetical protein [Spiroplasma floricola]AUB31650.1 hypothetical protein SFLOR_v1c05980 [Spiroplasma floricola 23-6]